MMANADLITITAIDPKGPSVQCRHGDGSSKYTGQNGWQFTQRPRRVSMTEFMGYDPYTLIVPVIFGNGFDKSVNIEPSLEVLRGLGRNEVGPRIEPAVLKIKCPAIPLTWLTWTLQDMVFNVEYRNQDGSRYYASMSLTFFEYVPTDLVATKAAKSIAMKTVSTRQVQTASSLTTTPPLGGGGAGSPGFGLSPTAPHPGDNPTLLSETPMSGNTYVVKKHDTLETIAHKQLGAARYWKQIAKLNGIRDPKAIEVGEVLRMPKNSIITFDKNHPNGVQSGGKNYDTGPTLPGDSGYGVLLN
jgi:LysM repeat protein